MIERDFSVSTAHAAAAAAAASRAAKLRPMTAQSRLTMLVGKPRNGPNETRSGPHVAVTGKKTQPRI